MYPTYMCRGLAGSDSGTPSPFANSNSATSSRASSGALSSEASELTYRDILPSAPRRLPSQHTEEACPTWIHRSVASFSAPRRLPSQHTEEACPTWIHRSVLAEALFRGCAELEDQGSQSDHSHDGSRCDGSGVRQCLYANTIALELAGPVNDCRATDLPVSSMAAECDAHTRRIFEERVQVLLLLFCAALQPSSDNYRNV